jgi:hypothetical protein
MKLIPHLHPVLRLRTCAAVFVRPLYVVMQWVDRYRDKVTFTFNINSFELLEIMFDWYQ